jgi:Predicted transcriptional regulators
MYERIRNLREDKDISQAKMAAYLRIHQTTYSDYELGNLNIPIPVLDKLADLFETSIDYLVSRTDEKKPYPAINRKTTKEAKQ